MMRRCLVILVLVLSGCRGCDDEPLEDNPTTANQAADGVGANTAVLDAEAVEVACEARTVWAKGAPQLVDASQLERCASAHVARHSNSTSAGRKPWKALEVSRDVVFLRLYAQDDRYPRAFVLDLLTGEERPSLSLEDFNAVLMRDHVAVRTAEEVGALVRSYVLVETAPYLPEDLEVEVEAAVDGFTAMATYKRGTPYSPPDTLVTVAGSRTSEHTLKLSVTRKGGASQVAKLDEQVKVLSEWPPPWQEPAASGSPSSTP